MNKDLQVIPKSTWKRRIKNYTPECIKMVIFNIRMQSSSWSWDFKMCFTRAPWVSLLVDLPRLMTQCCSSCRRWFARHFWKRFLCSYLACLLLPTKLFYLFKLTFFGQESLTCNLFDYLITTLVFQVDRVKRTGHFSFLLKNDLDFYVSHDFFLTYI